MIFQSRRACHFSHTIPSLQQKQARADVCRRVDTQDTKNAVPLKGVTLKEETRLDGGPDLRTMPLEEKKRRRGGDERKGKERSGGHLAYVLVLIDRHEVLLAKNEATKRGRERRKQRRKRE